MINRFRKSVIGLTALLFVSLLASSQIMAATTGDVSTASLSGRTPLVPTWSRTYGGGLSDGFNSMAPTSDGGYIVAGFTLSFGAGYNDVWVLKLDASGNITWQKTYGSSNHEYATSVAQTSDGGYIVAGGTDSFGAGQHDVWLLKLDSGGNVVWQQTYGGPGDERFPRISQTSEGGYILGANTTSFGAGGTDIWLLKLTSSGNITWQKTYGGPLDDFLGAIIQSSGGGYVVSGTTNSFGAGSSDLWVLKLDASGNIIWQNTYGGTGAEEASPALAQTADGNYVVGGSTTSFGAGAMDAWVLKLDSATGSPTLSKTYGGAGDEFIDFILPTSDGGYVFSADSPSFSSTNRAWIVKLDSSGNITWQKIYGGSKLDSPNPVFATSDGGYVVAGYTQSFGAGNNDGWVFKTDANGNLAGICPAPTDTVATVTVPLFTVHSTTITPGVTSIAPGTTSVTPANTFVTPGDTSRCFLDLPLILR